MEDNQQAEKTSLLRSKIKGTKFKFCRYRRFIQSKAALIILLWNFMVSLVFFLIFFSNLLLDFDYSLIIVHGCVSLAYLLYPLAGYLADSRFGRYRTIVASLVLTGLGVITVLIALVLKMEVADSSWKTVASVVMLMGMMVISLSNVGFSANVLQYGLDQLYEFPSDDQILFIHWYSWSTEAPCFIALLTLNIGASASISSTTVNLILIGITTLVLIIMLMSVVLASMKKK